MKTYTTVNEIPEGYVPLSALKMDRNVKNVLRCAVYEDRLSGARVLRPGSRYTSIWVHARDAMLYADEHQNGSIRANWPEFRDQTPQPQPKANWFQRVWAKIVGRLLR